MRLFDVFGILAALIPGAAWAECEVDVEGAVTASAKSKGGASEMGTDYWFKPAELAAAVKIMAGMTAKKEELDKKVAEAMKRDPKIMTFILNCMTDPVTIHFMPQGKYADVPFKPKSYVIPKGSAKSGEVGVLIKVGNEFYRVSEPGVFQVTAFDAKRFAGSFQLKAERNGKSPVAIKGKFDYGCLVPTEFCRDSK